MQKVFQRTILAEKQAARKKTKIYDRLNREWRKSNREQNQVQRKDVVYDLKKARFDRREDYELGPLAPRRDVGDSKETYGTVKAHQIRGPILEQKARFEALEMWGGRYLNLRVQDRVVLLSGRDKGKIGEVSNLDLERAQCTVKGLNMIDVPVPAYMLMNAEEADKRPYRSIEQQFPLSQVRLVYPLPHPETGVVRDVIIKKLIRTKVWHNRETGSTRWSRVIPGLDIVVPWPQMERRTYKTHEADTIRLDVEAKTFIPSLLTPPMPGSVIDELRNKYSVFRTRHEPEYIAAKIKEDEEIEAKKQTAAEMRTPMNDANRKARKERKAKGKGKLTPEMLERIGEVIARKRKLALDAAGVQKVVSTPVTA